MYDLKLKRKKNEAAMYVEFAVFVKNLPCIWPNRMQLGIQRMEWRMHCESDGLERAQVHIFSRAVVCSRIFSCAVLVCANEMIID